MPKQGLNKKIKDVDLKVTAGVHTSNSAKMSDLASLKSNVDKLDIDKLVNYQVV